jgi:hypothetical protein
LDTQGVGFRLRLFQARRGDLRIAFGGAVSLDPFDLRLSLLGSAIGARGMMV